jgi:3-methyladenine DNA glycosylase AlkD
MAPLVDYVSYYRERLQQVAVEADREPMERYMRNQFSFIGVKSVARREVMRQGILELGIPPEESWFEWVRLMWDAEREIQYIAMDILKRRKKHFNEDHLPMLEWMLTQNVVGYRRFNCTPFGGNRFSR